MGCTSSVAASEEKNVPQPNPNFVDITHFTFIRQIGKGGFAEVFVARRANGPKELVAIKRVDKLSVLRIKEDGQGGRKGVRMSSTVWTERNVWGMIDSPFLVQLIHAFQDDRYLYFVMPLFAGGDLSLYLKHYGIMNEAMIRYYIAEIVLAIECLHSCNIVYRDLKPQNVLMRPDGHICLTDFGLCKLNPPKGNGISDLKGRIGTKGYQAPEIVRGLGHSFPVDFFALGVTIYRLATDSRLFAKNKTTFPYPIPVPVKHMVLIPTLDPALARATFTGDEGQQWHNAQNAYGAYTNKTPTPVTAARESQRNHIAKNQVKSAGEMAIQLPPALADFIQQLVDVDPSYRLGTKNRAMRSGSPVTAAHKASPSPRMSPVPTTDDPSIAEVYSQYGATSDMSASNASVTGRVRAGTMMSTNKQAAASRRMTSSQPQPVISVAPRQEEDADEAILSESDNGGAPRNASPSLSARKKPHPAASPRFGARRTPSVQSSGSRGKYKMTLFRGRDEMGNWNALHSGFQQIKHHPFFDGFDWDAVADLRMAPPFMPIVNISAVQQVFKADPNERTQTKTRLTPEEQTLFHGFELNHIIRRATDSAASSTSANMPPQARPTKRRH